MLFPSLSSYSQIDRGGVPRSFLLNDVQKTLLKVIEVPSPDMISIREEDNQDAKLEKSYRVGIDVPVFISLADAGQWDNLPDGGRLCRVMLKCKDAQGIGLNYSTMRLPKGSDIFVYSPYHTSVIGAIASSEIPDSRHFTTRPIAGDEIVLEYYEPSACREYAEIEISGIVYVYRGFESAENQQIKSASSGSCEVNVNCEEGQNWQNQKRGVVKIFSRVTNTTVDPNIVSHFWCTGNIMNNTAQDFSGLLLSAAHCSVGGGVTASPEDYSKWVFYFNYESEGCSNTGSEEYTIVGAEKLAIADNSSDVGSDFLLLRFLQDIPPAYQPFYCGWDAGPGGSSSGVCIHHPGGDIKKISTYTSPLVSDTWGSTLNTHWKVYWAATTNGHGVTEGGSSGSALFDDEGLVVGTETGGYSSCQNPDAQDYYGKLSYSWTSNGTFASQQLKPWLDPESSGLLKMPGSFNDKLAVADFSADTYVIPVGGTVNFQDLSAGKPDKWVWRFQKGNPSESTEQNPSGIRFESFGKMNVKLVVSNAYNSDSIVKEGFIDVRSVMSPNPSTGVVTILADINNENDLIIEVYDAQGKIAQKYEYAGLSAVSYTITLPDYGNIFIVRVIRGEQVQTHKVFVVH